LLARNEVKARRIACLTNERITLSKGYYACFPHARRSGSLEEAVTHWMEEEARSDDA
jgi:hypothetical protein